MGFNKLMIPSVEELEKRITEVGEQEFGIYWHKRLMKADALMGDSAAVDIIKQFAEKAYNVQKNIQEDKV